MFYLLGSGQRCRRTHSGQVQRAHAFRMYSYAKFPSMSVSKATLSILQDHYPERLGQMLIANPPMLFSTFWSPPSCAFTTETP